MRHPVLRLSLLVTGVFQKCFLSYQSKKGTKYKIFTVNKHINKQKKHHCEREKGRAQYKSQGSAERLLKVHVD